MGGVGRYEVISRNVQIIVKTILNSIHQATQVCFVVVTAVQFFMIENHYNG